MKKLSSVIALGLFLGTVFSIKAFADWRRFVWSYEYFTIPEGRAEFEHYNTSFWTERTGNLDDKQWEQQFEIEYGVTDRLDIAFYQVYRQKPAQSLEYRGYKVRSRYRFGERGTYFVDPLLYLEFIHKGDELELEEKLVLGKNFGKIFSAFNATFEQEWEDGKYKELKIVPSIGVGYRFPSNITLGLEALNHIEIVDGKQEHSALFVGPTFSVMSSKGWASIGYLHQVTDVLDEHYKYQTRLLIGIFL